MLGCPLCSLATPLCFQRQGSGDELPGCGPKSGKFGAAWAEFGPMLAGLRPASTEMEQNWALRAMVGLAGRCTQVQLETGAPDTLCSRPHALESIGRRSAASWKRHMLPSADTFGHTDVAHNAPTHVSSARQATRRDRCCKRPGRREHPARGRAASTQPEARTNRASAGAQGKRMRISAARRWDLTGCRQRAHPSAMASMSSDTNAQNRVRSEPCRYARMLNSRRTCLPCLTLHNLQARAPRQSNTSTWTCTNKNNGETLLPGQTRIQESPHLIDDTPVKQVSACTRRLLCSASATRSLLSA